MRSFWFRTETLEYAIYFRCVAPSVSKVLKWFEHLITFLFFFCHSMLDVHHFQGHNDGLLWREQLSTSLMSCSIVWGLLTYPKEEVENNLIRQTLITNLNLHCCSRSSSQGSCWPNPDHGRGRMPLLQDGMHSGCHSHLNWGWTDGGHIASATPAMKVEMPWPLEGPVDFSVEGRGLHKHFENWEPVHTIFNIQ